MSELFTDIERAVIAVDITIDGTGGHISNQQNPISSSRSASCLTVDAIMLVFKWFAASLF